MNRAQISTVLSDQFKWLTWKHRDWLRAPQRSLILWFLLDANTLHLKRPWGQRHSYKWPHRAPGIAYVASRRARVLSAGQAPGQGSEAHWGLPCQAGEFCTRGKGHRAPVSPVLPGVVVSLCGSAHHLPGNIFREAISGSQPGGGELFLKNSLFWLVKSSIGTGNGAAPGVGTLLP